MLQLLLTLQDQRCCRGHGPGMGRDVVCGREGGRSVTTLSYLRYGFPGFSPQFLRMFRFVAVEPSTAVTQSGHESLPAFWNKNTALPDTKCWPVRDPGLGNRLVDGAAGSRSLVHLSADRLFATGHPLATSDCLLG